MENHVNPPWISFPRKAENCEDSLHDGIYKQGPGGPDVKVNYWS